jgi:alpha-glucosidase (family GH31 glycosyl hydrolase)
MNVYVPKRSQGWFNFWTGEHVPGGRTVLIDAKLGEIPVFVPAGSILPFGPTEQYDDQHSFMLLHQNTYQDAIHFNQSGSAFEAERAAQIIRPLLAKQGSDLR